MGVGRRMRDTGGRHELKHYINHVDLLQLRARLPCVMSVDENAEADGGYRVRSLYFDNYNDKVLREKIDGVDDREKFRLRFYNNDVSFIRLEKKSKKGGVCFKRSAHISDHVCSELLEGNYDALKETGDPLHMEFYTKLRHELLRPQNIVDYRREAFVFLAGQVRGTLDYDIRSGFYAADFLKPRYISLPIPEVIILEVKYDHFLPELIRGVTSLSSRRSTAFSKYAATRII